MANYSGNSHDRRKARRRDEKRALEALNTGDKMRLATDAYGKSYKGRTVTVHRVSVRRRLVSVMVPKRKSPMRVNALHLETKS